MGNLKFSAWPCEKAKLAEFINKTPGKYAVEIGSYLGMTTIAMADACRMVGKRLVAIDPWDGRQDQADESVYQQFLENTKDFAPVIDTIRAGSLEAKLPTDLPNNCGVVFVDGEHTYPQCLWDMQRYYPLLSPGGVLAVHDTFCPGWIEAVGRGFSEFIESLAPVEVYHLVYHPTRDECGPYNHNKTGLSWVVKPQKVKYV